MPFAKNIKEPLDGELGKHMRGGVCLGSYPLHFLKHSMGFTHSIPRIGKEGLEGHDREDARYLPVCICLKVSLAMQAFFTPFSSSIATCRGVCKQGSWTLGLHLPICHLLKAFRGAHAKLYPLHLFEIACFTYRTAREKLILYWPNAFT